MKDKSIRTIVVGILESELIYLRNKYLLAKLHHLAVPSFETLETHQQISLDINKRENDLRIAKELTDDEAFKLGIKLINNKE